MLATFVACVHMLALDFWYPAFRTPETRPPSRLAPGPISDRFLTQSFPCQCFITTFQRFITEINVTFSKCIWKKVEVICFYVLIFFPTWIFFAWGTVTIPAPRLIRDRPTSVCNFDRIQTGGYNSIKRSLGIIKADLKIR